MRYNGGIIDNKEMVGRMIEMLCQNIERLRKERGITQERMANVLGVSRPTYINIENGSREPNVSELEKMAAVFGVSAGEMLMTPRNNKKFEQMYFYILRKFPKGVTKTKLAKLLYLADFSYYYDNLESMSGVTYIRRDYGPVADIFFETTDNLFDTGKISIQPLDRALIIKSTSREKNDELLSHEEKRRMDDIVQCWKEKSTQEIVNFTHEQKPWKTCMDGEKIPYTMIIQEDPDHVYTPNT